MRAVGHVLLWCGFLGGAFTAVRSGAAPAPSALLPAYPILLAVGIAGVVLLRMSAGRALAHAPKVEGEMTLMRAALERLCAALDRMLGERSSIDVFDVHERIDEELLKDLAGFAEARESMIPAFGLEGYADVMTCFAGAERLINRAWSASADGYVDEVWSSLEQAATLMREARDRFLSRVPSARAAP